MSTEYAKSTNPLFHLITQFGGYRNKTDITNIPEEVTTRSGVQAYVGYLVAGSQNVIITDADKVSVRNGYALDGPAAASTAPDPIVSSYDFFFRARTAGPTEAHLRVHNKGGSGVIEFRYVAVGGTVSWNTLMTSTTNSTWDGTTLTFNFAEYWDTTEINDLLLFVNGDSSVYSWSGATATFASATASTITLQGTKTWAQLGFLTATTGRGIIINGTKYTYTGGESTTTLTGVSPDPSGSSYAAGAVITQSVLNFANSTWTGTNKIPAAFGQDLIAVMNNQVWYGSTARRDIYVSKQNNFQTVDFTGSMPPAAATRLPGEGLTFNLDAAPVGFVVSESPSKTQVENDVMFIDAGKDYTYQIVFRLNSTLTAETFIIRRMQTSPQSAAFSQSVIAKVVNSIVKITNEPTIDNYANIEKQPTPKYKPIGDTIKTDLKNFSFTSAHMIFWQQNLYIALPSQSSGTVLIYNLAKGYWEAPQVLPIRRWSIIGGLLYGHSSQVGETYQMFTGTNDNGNPINAIAAFSYFNFGSRFSKKNFTEFLVEGYISSNTQLQLTCNYDFGGSLGIQSFDIWGTDGQYSSNKTFGAIPKTIYAPVTDNSIGINPLGEQPIGTISGSGLANVNKFRVIRTTKKIDFWELQFAVQSNGVDQAWQLLALGPAIIPSGASNAELKI